VQGDLGEVEVRGRVAAELRQGVVEVQGHPAPSFRGKRSGPWRTLRGP
jgi:hypothetical protein